jgi:hypothetical protein
MEPTLKILPDGTKYWYIHGELHREDGPAIIRPSGTQEWWLNGIRHRKDGPAVIYPDGYQEWWLNGERHREDGPAIINSDGTKYWYINGKQITKEVNDWAKERNIDLNNMSDMDKMILKIEIKMWK